MEYIIFVSAIIFWIVYYIFEGMHDANFAKETALLSKHIDKEKYSQIKPDFVKYELRWKLWDSLEKALVKIVSSIMIYYLTDDLVFSVLMLALAACIRAIMHDLVVALGLGKGLSHIGPDYIYWDRFLRRMSEKGINQYVIKLTPTIIVSGIILYYLG